MFLTLNLCLTSFEKPVFAPDSFCRRGNVNPKGRLSPVCLATDTPAKRAARVTGAGLLLVGSLVAACPQLALRWWFPSPYFSPVSVRLIGLVAQGYGVYYLRAAVSPTAFFWSTVFFRMYLAAVLGCWLFVLGPLAVQPIAVASLRLCLGSIAFVNFIGAIIMLSALLKAERAASHRVPKVHNGARLSSGERHETIK